MFNPVYDTEDRPETTLHIVQPAVKPGTEGMKPAMLISAMIAGGGMWMGIFYLGHMFLQAITG